jgi:hypothetical protein
VVSTERGDQLAFIQRRTPKKNPSKVEIYGLTETEAEYIALKVHELNRDHCEPLLRAYSQKVKREQ